MPVSIGVQGGASRSEALRKVSEVESEKALDTLQQIKAHLSKPGHDKGVLTLHNRTNAGVDVTLERKSGFQLLFQSDKRLNDTVTAMKNLLSAAGQHGAQQELDLYLTFGKGDRNRIEAGKMLDILNCHLQPPPPLQLGESFKQYLAENEEAYESVKDRITPGDLSKIRTYQAEQTDRLAPLVGSSMKDLYESGNMKAPRGGDFEEHLRDSQRDQSGASGFVVMVEMNGREYAFKKIIAPTPMDLTRKGAKVQDNETMASYLRPTRKNQTEKEYNRNDYLAMVNIADPISYLVSIEKENGKEFRMVDAPQIRQLLKFQPKGSVECHGLVMPKAPGACMNRTITTENDHIDEKDRVTLTETQKKRFCHSLLQSIQGLNLRGFVHRDLAPKNCFYDPGSGVATLIDTGSLFKQREKDPEHSYIFAGGAKGTYHYIHPRVLDPKGVGTETDLYALAKMTLELEHPGFSDATPMTALKPFMTAIEKGIEKGSLTKDTLKQTLESMLKKDTLKPEERDAIVKLHDDFENSGTLANFAIDCFIKAGELAETWGDRTKAQTMYRGLLEHEALKTL